MFDENVLFLQLFFILSLSINNNNNNHNSNNSKLWSKSTNRFKTRKFCQNFKKSLNEKFSNNLRDKFPVIVTWREKPSIELKNFNKIRRGRKVRIKIRRGRKVRIKIREIRMVPLVRTQIYPMMNWLWVRINLQVIRKGIYQAIWSVFVVTNTHWNFLSILVLER